MAGQPVTDREAYPAAWITLGVLAAAFLIWRFALGEPTVSRCWVWEHWRVYCPGCGGTRALIALARGQLGVSAEPDGVAPPGTAGMGPPLPPLVAGGHRRAVPGQLPGAERPVAGLRDPAVVRLTGVTGGKAL